MELDIGNAIYAGALVLILFLINRIPLIFFHFVFVHLFFVFLTNDFLFPIQYMPDQIRYLNATVSIRETLDFFHYYKYDQAGLSNVANASLFFSLFPIVNISSVFSISIINFMLYSFLFVYLYKRELLINSSLWFYFFYPSLALYAAIGGRDTLILCIMVLGVYQLYKDRLLLCLIISSPLIFIKFQNFLILILAVVTYKVFDSEKKLSSKNLFNFVVFLFSTTVFFSLIPIEYIDQMRSAMYREDGGDMLYYDPISGGVDLFITSIIGMIYIILKPLPWESTNVLQLMQSFENVFILLFIGIVIRRLYAVENKFKYFLFFYFSIAMGIYGVVVFNFGTAARYKYPFIVIFIIFSLKLIRDEKSKLNNS